MTKAADQRPATLPSTDPPALAGGRPTLMEVTHASQREAAAAAWWRRNIMHLTQEQLAPLIGYSVETVSYMEFGVTRRGKPYPAKAWRRYRLACSGIDHEIRHSKRFNWGQV